MTDSGCMSVRGIHFDLKAHMLRFEALCRAAREMAELGYNTVLLEYQDKFPFTGDLAPIAAEDALTREEIAAFNTLCGELGLEVIPLIQCIGHMYYVLRHEEFAHLADVIPGADQDALCPSHPGSMELFKAMTEQILEAHPDCRYLHIGGDEARLSDSCERCGGRPKYQLLADYYTGAVEYTASKGKKAILWGDMLLGHPETLEPLRGKVTVMDWNYHCEGGGDELPLVWGCDREHPESWSELHKKLILPYVWDEKGKTRPFHYLQFLKDQGFEVLAAPAVKCGGDPAFVPHHRHLPNCLAAVQAAEKAGIAGTVVTSWSVRRVPWLLTEKALMAAVMRMKDPGVSGGEIGLCFAERHFGVRDRELADIPERIARAAADAMEVCDLATIGHQHPWEDVGHVDDYALRQKHRRQVWKGCETIAPVYGKLAEEAKAVLELLKRADPRTDGQRERTAFWQWSAETALLLGEYAPLLAEESVDPETAKLFTERFEALGEKGEVLLRPWYTEFSMAADTASRIGIHTDYLKQFIG